MNDEDVAQRLIEDSDLLFEQIRAEQPEDGEAKLALLIKTYTKANTLLGGDPQVVFRIARTGLELAAMVLHSNNDLALNMSRTAANYFDQISGALSSEGMAIEVGKQVFLLPYHAEVNRAFCLHILGEPEEAQKLFESCKKSIVPKLSNRYAKIHPKLISSIEQEIENRPSLM